MNMTERHDKNFYLLVLAYALVEIRATDDPKLSAKVADVLHHIPEALTLDLDDERDQRLHEQMMVKARVHGLTDLINGWQRSAMKRLGGNV
jgi:hypothetical protein